MPLRFNKIRYLPIEKGQRILRSASSFRMTGNKLAKNNEVPKVIVTLLRRPSM